MGTSDSLSFAPGAAPISDNEFRLCWSNVDPSQVKEVLEEQASNYAESRGFSFRAPFQRTITLSSPGRYAFRAQERHKFKRNLRPLLARILQALLHR